MRFGSWEAVEERGGRAIKEEEQGWRIERDIRWRS